ncbi:MAG: hypothetical protein QME51_01275 [Planctomycetota bacterium]|nr:hypothetical protein [Planctomycetota bacterium]MDI6786986.1 hypothetical protein [Planctomycetota bacterium]
MIGFCLHCGASVPNEFIVKKGEILASPYVRCSYCGKMAGRPDKTDEADADMESIEKTGEVFIRDGKITPAT